MSKNLKSRKIILFNTVALLVFILLLISINSYFLQKINRQLSMIDAEYNQKLDIISQMARIVRERSLVMMVMSIASDPWERDQQFMNFHKLAPEFIALRDELSKMNLTELEEIELERDLAFIRKTEPLQNDIVERIHSGGDGAVQQDIYENDFPLETRLLVVFDDMINIVKTNTQKAKQEAQNSYQRALLILSGVGVLVLITTFYLMRKSLVEIQQIEANLIKETENLGWDATHDALTNIYNRRWLKHKINSLTEDDEAVHSIIYIDIDDFKPINDTYGHVTGDKYLKAFCREVEHCIRQNDTFSRMGGDEFAILLENCHEQKAKLIADNLHGRLNRMHVDVDGVKVSAGGMSMGIYVFRKNHQEFDQIIQHADHACYQGKHGGKNQVCTISNV